MTIPQQADHREGAALPGEVRLSAVPGVPPLAAGDDLPRIIAQALAAAGLAVLDGDVIVVAQKAVSKVEGRAVRLSDVRPTPESVVVAEACGKSPALVELIRSQSASLMRVQPGVVIARHGLGHVAANAGIDASNVEDVGGHETVLLWPVDPDASARRIRADLERALGVRIAVIISDSLGRAWRIGTVGTAIGVAGMKPLRTRTGEPDLFGRILQATETGVADEIAAAASLVIGEAAEGTPVALVRGARFEPSDDHAATDMLRPAHQDLFP